MTILTNLKDLALGKVKLNSPMRSSKWPSFKKKVIKEVGCCEVCGSKKYLEVHHKKPFHLFPELELVRSNTCVLCESGIKGINCHLFIGHLGNYSNYNPNIDEDIKYWHNRLLENHENGDGDIE